MQRPVNRRAAFLAVLGAATLVGRPGAVRAQAPGPSTRVPPAAEPEHGRSLDRGEAARLGALRGPGVAIAAAPRAAVSDARHAADALLVHRPRATISAGRREGDVGPGAELGLTVTQDFTTTSIGGERGRVAASLGELTERDVRRAEVDAAARAALAWVDAAEAEELFRLRRASQEQTDSLAALVGMRVRSGVSMPGELAMAQGEAGLALAAVLDAEGMVVEAKAELRFSTGMSADEPVEAIGDLYAADERPLDESSALRRAEAAHPAIAVADSRAKLARDEAELTTALLGPVFSVGGSYLREGTGDHIWAAVVTVPLPFADPAAFEHARQRASADVATAQAAALRAEVARDVRLALHDRHHWREVKDALVNGARGPLREAVRLARAQVEAGTHDITGLLLARQKLTAVEEQIARAAAEIQRADVRLSRATGRVWGLGEQP